MAITFRCMCITLCVLLLWLCVAEIMIMSTVSEKMYLEDWRYPRLTSFGLGIFGILFIFLGAILKKRVVLWIGIPVMIVVFVILVIVDIVVMVKHMYENSKYNEHYVLANLLIFLIVIPLFICVSWFYAKELRTIERKNRCINCLGF